MLSVALGGLLVEDRVWAQDHDMLSSAERADGWTLLFDGSSLNGLAPRGEARWEVADGTISAVEGSGRGLIATTAHHANFELRVDFWIDDTANSGVFIRCPAEGPITQGNAFEVNIYDPHDSWPTGSINEVAKIQTMPNTTGKWNTFEIMADGDHLSGQAEWRNDGRCPIRSTYPRSDRPSIQRTGSGEVPQRQDQDVGLRQGISMHRRAHVVIGLLVTLFVVSTVLATAEVVRVEVRSRTDLVGGESFGKAGPYEKIAGVIHFAVDPNNAANRIITDIDLAPRNADGMVEFRSDFFMLKPVDMSRGNGTVFLRSVEPRSQRDGVPVQSGRWKPGPSDRGGDGGRVPHAAGLHAVVGGMAVRRAAPRGSDATVCADCIERRQPDHGSREERGGNGAAYGGCVVGRPGACRLRGCRPVAC